MLYQISVPIITGASKNSQSATKLYELLPVTVWKEDTDESSNSNNECY